MIEFVVNGEPVSIADDRCSLLEALRDRLGIRSPKDGCSPQGQCGCCTVWIDGKPRVACVTPVGRVAGKRITTIEGLDGAHSWADALCATGGSQCGFCTPGIVMRLAALGPAMGERAAVDKALSAHLCRCTGWGSILEAAVHVNNPPAPDDGSSRDLQAAARRASLEGRTVQMVSPRVALGEAGFSADRAPADALIALLGADGEWVVGDTLTEARRLAGRVQGRRTTAPLSWPIPVPDGSWERTLQTTWVEPAYLEPDAAWCAPGGEWSSALANGGAFGGKSASPVGDAARRLADRYGRPVVASYTREDTVLLGPKRPPVAGGVDSTGAGVLHIARPPEAEQSALLAAVGSVAPRLDVVFVDVVGPAVSTAIRASGWAEAAVLTSGLGPKAGGRTDPGVAGIVSPDGAVARAAVTRAADGVEAVSVDVDCGDVLDEVVLRSYCIGAAHMALGWVRSEGLAVDEAGVPLDRTIRSFGVLRAADTPRIDVHIRDGDGPAENGSDAVFAAVAAAAWRAAGFASRWPAG